MGGVSVLEKGVALVSGVVLWLCVVCNCLHKRVEWCEDESFL